MLLAALLSSLALAAPVRVEVTGLRNRRGVARIYAWREATGFPSDTGQAAQAKVVALGDENTPVAVTFELEAGTWAFSVIHDEDHDGQLDTNFIGMPTEGVGASTKPGTSRLGPPRFTDATATIGTAGKTLRIELAYLL